MPLISIQRVIAAASFVVFPFVSVSFSGCTDPGDNTAIGAATGGVLGAGLGAIIGSQTGDAGEGVAIGALAGAGAGGFIGNSIDSQQKMVRSQDEAIERQQQLIAAQRRELDQLRGVQDPSASRTVPRSVSSSSAYPSSGPRASVSSPPVAPLGASSAGFAPRPELSIAAARPSLYGWPATSSTTASTTTPKFKEKSISPNATSSADNGDVPVVTGDPSGMQGAYKWRDSPAVNVPHDTKPSVGGPIKAAPAQGAVGQGAVARLPRSGDTSTPECAEARAEVQKGASLTESADKLFHYRRALRLCPDDASFHNGLGELYLTLSRKTDAEFEFREALTLDPQNATARDNLARLNK